MVQLTNLKSLFTYKPQKEQPFELLETEGSEEKEQTSGSKTDNESGMNNTDTSGSETDGNTVNTDNTNVFCSLKSNLDMIKKELSMPGNNDAVIREFKIGRKLNAFIVYIDGMVDRTFISDFIMRQLMDLQNFQDFFCNSACENITDYISDNVISVNEIAKETKLSNIIVKVLSGNTALFVDGDERCLLIGTKGYEKRSIDKPVTENVVYGSQEGFTENLRTNTSLVRKIIKNKNLITEIITVGQSDQDQCAIMYLKDVVNTTVVDEVKRRIKSVNVDAIIGGGMLSQLIEDNGYMLIPQTLVTERPDRTASFLMEGKIAIISEGAPFADIVPVTFFHLLQTSEDSSLRWQYGTFLRLIRIFGILIAILLPAMYVAITMFHHEMIPTELLASIAQAKEQVPFPTIVEVLTLEVSFELIREGGIRVPGVIGQTLGIIGALILGQAAVAAGLVSPILIIIVAVTGLGSFAIPNYPLGLGVRIIRFSLIFLAAILGFYGISCGIFILGCLVCSMKSFGVPFFAPIAPKTNSNPDIIIRHPTWKQNQRPDFLNTQKQKKQAENPRGWKSENKGDNRQ